MDVLVTRAMHNREERIRSLQSRERLVPVLDAYDTVLDKLSMDKGIVPPVEGLSYLTSLLRSTYEEVKSQIAAAGKTGISQINAIKRSAGTNYQGLCEYAILKWLQTTELPVSVRPNAPELLKDELTIHGHDEDGEFSVEPDIDICLWIDRGASDSPLLFVSAKTSLVDRAGQAARWKLYFNLHQTTCPHIDKVHDCPIHRTKINIKTNHPIEHCIVTANIYKMDTTQPEGELRSGQCRNNTYMFRHKYTTRRDPKEYRPAGWKSFSEFPKLVKKVFS